MALPPADERKKVWSSDGTPTPAPPPSPVPAKGSAAGRVRVRLERQGRGGKVVSVVENLPGHPERIEQVARTLKSKCGAGGTVKGRLVEIQGDHRDRIVAALLELGLDAVRAGG
jgi:translation initiation factor 1